MVTRTVRTPVTVNLPIAEDKRLKEHCQREGLSISQAIRDAISMYLDTADDLRNIQQNVCDILSGQAPSKLEMGEL